MLYKYNNLILILETDNMRKTCKSISILNGIVEGSAKVYLIMSKSLCQIGPIILWSVPPINNEVLVLIDPEREVYIYL